MSPVALRPIATLRSVGCSSWAASAVLTPHRPATTSAEPARQFYTAAPRETASEHVTYRHSSRQGDQSSVPPSMARGGILTHPDTQDRGHATTAEARNGRASQNAREAVRQESRHAGSRQAPAGRGATVSAPAPESASIPQSAITAFETSPRATAEQGVSANDAASKAATMAKQVEGRACSSLSPSSPSAPRTQQPVSSSQSQTIEAEGPAASTPVASSGMDAGASAAAKSAPRKGSQLKAQKAAISLTPTAVERLRSLLHGSQGPRLIRIGVRNKGCAGMSYHLEYVKPEEAGRFDERVKQDGVEVLVDSKALFSIIGSEMDWQEDRLSAKFVFNNPNVTDACGCGESWTTV